MFKPRELFREWPRDQANVPAHLQLVAELQNTARVRRLNQRLDHSAWNWVRPIALHNQP